ncbi:REP-associated tyrosine transposase [Neisseria lactamica]|uniref:REP-associated tyrosine transposase n=1 Tax=Neisseria lactamica TaxID=486 RepID=UPI0024B1E977|nr:transposase [Neisseria lactamica]
MASACRTYRLRGQHIWMYKQYPFETVAVCVLPNHIHAIWTLPPDDADYSLLRRLIKTKFSAYSPHTKNLSAGKQRRNERGIWQRRFYEYTVRDETDLQYRADYIHSNPIKQKMSRAKTESCKK